MAHYAFINDENIVTEVIVGVDENEVIEGLSPEHWYSKFRGQKCVRTSYNGKIRKNYAGIGYTYDSSRDAFIPPQPFNSWILNEQTCIWLPPKPYPTEGFYQWNEEKLDWINAETL